jgi:hypothetical protein
MESSSLWRAFAPKPSPDDPTPSTQGTQGHSSRHFHNRLASLGYLLAFPPCPPERRTPSWGGSSWETPLATNGVAMLPKRGHVLPKLALMTGSIAWSLHRETGSGGQFHAPQFRLSAPMPILASGSPQLTQVLCFSSQVITQGSGAERDFTTWVPDSGEVGEEPSGCL